MSRKRPDLNKRLAEVRQEPAPPVDITLRLDAELYQSLKALARRHRQPLEAYLVRVLAQQVE
jgi:hypothetical protein